MLKNRNSYYEIAIVLALFFAFAFACYTTPYFRARVQQQLMSIGWYAPATGYEAVQASGEKLADHHFIFSDSEGKENFSESELPTKTYTRVSILAEKFKN